MQIQNITLPVSVIESFEKLAKKIQKNVPEFKFAVGKPYKKVYRHGAISVDGRVFYERFFHNVVDCVIESPEVNEWYLAAAVKEGNLLIYNHSEKLVLKEGHGVDCKKCDICGHKMKNSYIIRSNKTGEELQIGGECVNKFGIKCFDYISKFTSELYRIMDYRDHSDCKDGEPLPWYDNVEKFYGQRAIERHNVIKAAKAYWNDHKVWNKGSNGSRVTVGDWIGEGIGTSSKEYTDSVCKYYLDNWNDNDYHSEFAYEMKRVAEDYYSAPDDGVFAYFLVKNYEDNHTNINIPNVGDFVHFSGTIIKHEVKQGWYGVYSEYSILLENGMVLVRRGTVNSVDNKVSGYATVNEVKGTTVYLDRIVKNKKKGINIIEL